MFVIQTSVITVIVSYICKYFSLNKLTKKTTKETQQQQSMCSPRPCTHVVGSKWNLHDRWSSKWWVVFKYNVSSKLVSHVEVDIHHSHYISLCNSLCYCYCKPQQRQNVHRSLDKARQAMGDNDTAHILPTKTAQTINKQLKCGTSVNFAFSRPNTYLVYTH